jgi:hypothetical protein
MVYHADSGGTLTKDLWTTAGSNVKLLAAVVLVVIIRVVIIRMVFPRAISRL